MLHVQQTWWNVMHMEPSYSKSSLGKIVFDWLHVSKSTISGIIAEHTSCKNIEIRGSFKTKIGHNNSNYRSLCAGSQQYNGSLSFDNYLVKLVSSQLCIFLRKTICSLIHGRAAALTFTILTCKFNTVLYFLDWSKQLHLRFPLDKLSLSFSIFLSLLLYFNLCHT